jgi:Farnesoic acid 0-methyl transferase
VRRHVLFALCLAGCKVKDPPPITTKLTDDFERTSIGDNYYQTGDGFAVVSGALSAHGVHNQPMWLRAKLPRNARIEFDCWSTESRGDLKVEVFGDGRSHDPDPLRPDGQGNRYTATGYEVIFGGWYNSKSIIARLDEHGKDVAQRTLPKVVPNQHYHWKLERKGKQLSWWIDDMTVPFLVLDDPAPLEGSGHEYFAFNNWETDTWFDNLVISPL